MHEHKLFYLLLGSGDKLRLDVGGCIISSSLLDSFSCTHHGRGVHPPVVVSIISLVPTRTSSANLFATTPEDRCFEDKLEDIAELFLFLTGPPRSGGPAPRRARHITLELRVE